MTTEKGANSGPELLVELDRTTRRPLRAQLEDGLREAVRSGRLPARAAAGHARAGVRSRRLAAARGRRLCAAARRGLPDRTPRSGHVRGRRRKRRGRRPAAEPESRARRRSTSFPAIPISPRFPRRAWMRALRETLREAPDRAFGYPDPRGAPELRRALAEHLRRVRGVVADPQSIVVCSGAAQGFVLLARALAAGRDRGRGPRAAAAPGDPRRARAPARAARRSTSRAPAWESSARLGRGTPGSIACRSSRRPTSRRRAWRSRRPAGRRCWSGRARRDGW